LWPVLGRGVASDGRAGPPQPAERDGRGELGRPAVLVSALRGCRGEAGATGEDRTGSPDGRADGPVRGPGTEPSQGRPQGSGTGRHGRLLPPPGPRLGSSRGESLHLQKHYRQQSSGRQGREGGPFGRGARPQAGVTCGGGSPMPTKIFRDPLYNYVGIG